MDPREIHKNPKTIFSSYLKDLSTVAHQGDAREESFYPALAKMLEAFAHATGRTHVHVTTLPRPTDGGNPDFRIWNGTDRIIGYVEAKSPPRSGSTSSRSRNNSNAIDPRFPNLILTNFPRISTLPKRRTRREGSGGPSIRAQFAADHAAT